ncbi:MAG: GNAT family N-acetyltransferase [Acidobacteria bacterium]|nr:GNAT family N-acetyltransferase [Acidobacteriota bacterium]MCZ6506070.1 GNAT family N-acetyltransferase [Actinomycetota bacterium]MCH7900803.1 GNAT family N-acetyltransferase [Acidobacteriota bacterium]MCH8971146.1 GNAT family N-acetyltransferase [Acidobacteriota bacterium]MCZ6630376.1 GNAT family N-acetyltransferase [Actinomycetota bacterium]
MRVAARKASPDDIDVLVSLYRSLEEEMVGLHRMWPLADGLAEPIENSFASALEDPDVVIMIGTIDDTPLGFLLARVEPLLEQAADEKVGAIRLIFVDHEAREVAVGEEMRDAVMEMLRQRGITKFDAHVLPGHRLAKNFFEAGGFSARSIVMHHDDNRG